MFYRNIRLDTLFDSSRIDEALKSAGLTRVREYPDLESLLIRYQKRLKKALAYSIPFSYGETYTQSVTINENNSYQVAWNIAKAKKAIKQYGITMCGLSLKYLIGVVDQKCINQSHLEAALKNNAPVIAALYPQLNSEKKLLLIDGNHRVTAKFKEDQKEIPAYVLEPDQHLQAMIGEAYRVLFKIHYNYYLITSYMGGKLATEILEQLLYPL